MESQKNSKIWWLRFKDLKPSERSPASDEDARAQLHEKVK